ncbi:hypothetical protein [Salinispora arenicola]|uniref:hypothetical protein n=1 Tax=Salinispora arenicola TaxID=168697 RepID=UPI0003735BBB|nr:hypothetical protein [Salinispora arenicola]
MRGRETGGRVVPLARPGRPALVLSDLADLRGPTCGEVELPLRLAWSPPTRFDLDNRDDLRWMYEIVLREAIHEKELQSFLHDRILMDAWPTLNLPRGVRQAWEARHPQLRQAA